MRYVDRRLAQVGARRRAVAEEPAHGPAEPRRGRPPGSRTHRLVYNGEQVSFEELSRRTGIRVNTLRDRWYRMGLREAQLVAPVDAERSRRAVKQSPACVASPTLGLLSESRATAPSIEAQIARWCRAVFPHTQDAA